MALWGNNDSVGSGGLVSLNYSTLVVTGSGTTFGQAGAASTGDVIRFGDRTGTYFGDAVIVGIASTTQLSIASTSNLSGAAIASTAFSVSQLPKFTTLDSHYNEKVTTYDAYVYGADVAETEASAYTSYSLTHAGWVGVTTYNDSEGNLRVKSETLVAMSSIVNDEEDAVLVDYAVRILTQPTSIGVGTTATATFTVVAATAPTGGSLSYQWQYSNTGVAYTNLTNNTVYSGTTTAGLAVTNTSAALNGYKYRVVVSAASGNSVTSRSATLTVS